MARRQPIGCSQTLANSTNPETRRMQHPIDTITQRGDALCVHLASKHLAYQFVELFAPDLPPRLPAPYFHSRSPARQGSMPQWRGFYTRLITSGTEGTPQGTDRYLI